MRRSSHHLSPQDKIGPQLRVSTLDTRVFTSLLFPKFSSVKLTTAIASSIHQFTTRKSFTMRFTSITLFAAFSALAVAQLESLGIPKCALDCFGKNQGDCGPTDVKCLCSNSTLISAIACCVSKDCPAEEQKCKYSIAKSVRSIADRVTSDN